MKHEPSIKRSRVLSFVPALGFNDVVIMLASLGWALEQFHFSGAIDDDDCGTNGTIAARRMIHTIERFQRRVSMRFVVVLAALAGLLGVATTANAQSLGPRCTQACPSCCAPSKYSGHCFYPHCQRPIPPDPWAGRGQGGKQGEGFQWHPYLRSPRDFWMTQPWG